MGLAAYRSVLRLPAVRRVLLVGMVIRVPLWAGNVVLTLHVVTHLHESGATLRGGYTGVYDCSPDLQPMLGPVRSIPGLHVAVGFSGHGFKISPAVGRLVADLVIDGRSADPRIPEADFRLSRFAENDLLKTPYPYVGAGQMR